MLQKYTTKYATKHTTKNIFKKSGLKTFFENKNFFFLKFKIKKSF